MSAAAVYIAAETDMVLPGKSETVFKVSEVIRDSLLFFILVYNPG